MHLLKKLSDFLASYKLSCALFLLLLLLTYLGTMYQVENGLYQSQQKYFESLVLVHWAFDSIPVPLPGGYLVMMLTFINLLWGVVVRFRMQWSKVGIVTAHTGILILLVGSFISYVYSINGNMVLYENEASSEVENVYKWEMGISEEATGKTATEYIIRQENFENLTGDASGIFTFPNVPFTLTITGYAPNSSLKETPNAEPGGGILALPLQKENMSNLAGARIILTAKENEERAETVIWAGNQGPTVVEICGKPWRFSLRKERIQLPFSIRLDRFTRNLHPGTNMPKEFISEITKIEDGLSQQFRVSMNEPFRHLGYTFYQSSWGPQNARQGEPLYSVFSVVKNPADKVPLYACIITTAGLIFHFVRKLRLYLKKAKAQNVCVDE